MTTTDHRVTRIIAEVTQGLRIHDLVQVATTGLPIKEALLLVEAEVLSVPRVDPDRQEAVSKEVAVHQDRALLRDQADLLVQDLEAGNSPASFFISLTV